VVSLPDSLIVASGGCLDSHPSRPARLGRPAHGPRGNALGVNCLISSQRTRMPATGAFVNCSRITDERYTLAVSCAKRR
jgi:hypothetical protein